MEKCQNSKRSGKTLPDLLSFGGWVIVFVALIMINQNSLGCFRAVGRLARRPVRIGVQQVDDLSPSHSAVEVSPQLSPQTQETQSNGQGSERCHQHSTHGCRSTHEELGPTPPEFFELEEPDGLTELEEFTEDLPSSRNSQASPTSMNSPNPSSSQNVPPGIGYRNRLRERVRNGGRSFLRASGSFPLYSRRMMRNIHTRWGRFREKHPAAVKYAKWVSWLGGIAASVGSAVSLPVELYRTFHTLNKTDANIMTRIENVTSQLEQLQVQSEQEFQEYPDQTIFDLYHRPLRRDERGVYRLGFEDIPRSEENPTKMDPTYQDIPGFPPEIEEVELAMRTTSTTTTTSRPCRRAVWRRSSPCSRHSNASTK